ncbi:ATP-grasp domain-containing protein [Proteiniclasticum sp. QWL-01]|uniref:carboxylate--amine ligase n=1 Tax=Proteiniclasticum sp. QWL-01 TaxID=3036945 RepID=UPI002203C8B8|nr:ATP-grasp domain-containing protein [Proteiniclasticum sp. QWL-01]UUM11062.1 ATP-grasp domain-containing protein [Clostridiaceae bacterium HFYG-1003]WFF72393.1 ATP-grasp domain-containing protein [Proteiniclasticum sp. QWL-01]
MAYQNKAMVLGTNYYIGLSLVRGLGKMGVPVVAVNYSRDNQYGRSKYVTEELLVPHYKTHPRELCDALIEYAKKQPVKPVLFQTADAYAQFVDDFHDELKPWFLFPNQKKGLISDLVDKYKMVEYTDRFGVKTPEIIAADDADLAGRVDREIKYPCIIKPKDSATFIRLYRNKVFFIENEAQLLEKTDRCRQDGVEVFVQRIIPGPETNCYCWEGYMNQDSVCTHYTTVQKIRQWPNNFGAATYAKQKWIPECHEICGPFFEKVGYKGFAEVDLKRDETTGDIYLIEINCRYIGFTELLIALGFNTPFITYREMIGDPLPPQAWNYDTGYSWIHALEDKFARDKYKETGQISPEQMDEDTRSAGIRVSPIWSKEDPMPGITYTLYSAKKGWRRVRNILTGKRRSAHD